jgi:putative transcriptional regulator
MILHHPDEEILLDYAVGNLSEGLALVVATHVCLCSDCSAHVRLIETCGAALLDDVPEDSVDEHVLKGILERLDAGEPVPRQPITHLDAETEALLPGPLRRYMTKNLVDLDWRAAGRLFEEYRLPLARKDVRAGLYRLPAASLVPKHTHRGQEYTVVLAGAYRDGRNNFRRGDFSAMDASHQHQPVVAPEGPCICLVALDAPLKLSGATGFLLNPFLRM